MPENPTALATPPAGQDRAPDREFTVAQRSQLQLVGRRFLRHRLAVASLVVLVALILLAYVGGALWRFDAGEITPDNSQPPSWDHPFGTDAVGKDQFAQVLRGTRISLQIAVTVAILATVVGTLWGAVAAYFGGVVDSVMMRIADLILVLPLIAVAAMLAHNFGGTWYLIAFVIAGLYWAYVSRVVRGVVLSLREKEFIEAAKALGATDTRIILRHLVPNALGPIIVNATILVAIAILARDGAVLPRVRRAGPRHVAGPAGQRVADRADHPTVALLLPRAVHHPHRADHQLHRRRPARRVGPAADDGAPVTTAQEDPLPAGAASMRTSTSCSRSTS